MAKWCHGFRVPLAEVARPPKQNRSDCVRLFLPKTGQGRKASSPERAAANESILKVAHSQACGLCRRPRKESDIVFAELFMFIPIFITMFIFTFTLTFVFIFNVNVHVHGHVHVRVHVHVHLMFIFRFFI